MNLNISKFQKIEIGFFFLIACFYIQRQLFIAVNDFDFLITQAESLLGIAGKVWADLGHFNYNLNVIFPTIAAGILFFSAWLVFHLWVAPKYIKNPDSWQMLGFEICLTIGLVLASVLIFKLFRLYPKLKFDSNEHAIGMKVISIFRKLYVLSDTIIYTLVIVIYEIISQFISYNYTKYLDNKQPKHLVFSLIAWFIVTLFSVHFATVVNLPDVIIVGFKGVLALFIFLISTYFFYHISNSFILPFINKYGQTSLKQHLLFGIAIGLLAILYVILFAWWHNFSLVNQVDYVYPRRELIEFDLYDLIFLPNMLGLIIAKIKSIYLEETEQLQTLVFNKSAELQGLRSQINPHFIFNALNTLYSVALLENANKTANGVQKLGDMMRFMLHENHQERIPLSKEVDYLENFIEIQKMRLDETSKIDIKINIQRPAHDIYIAPMLLNPFVENAFKHGISLKNPSWIYITLTLDATQLYFKVHNSLHPKPEIDIEKGFGVGLENVKKRLQLIYPNRHKLDIQVSDQDYFVSLTLGLW